MARLFRIVRRLAIYAPAWRPGYIYDETGDAILDESGSGQPIEEG
jgi:hypothetical protein